MERRTFLKLAALVPGPALAGCGGSKTLLSPKDPTMLSIRMCTANRQTRP